MPSAPIAGGADAGEGAGADDAGSGDLSEARHGTASAIRTSSTASAGPINNTRFRMTTSLVSA